MYDVGFMCEEDEKEQRDDYYFAHTNVVTKCSLGFWPITPQYYIFNDVHRTKHGSGSFLVFNDGGFMVVLYFWIYISLGFVCYDGILWHHILFIISIETLSRKPQKIEYYFCIKILILHGSILLGFSLNILN